MNNDTTNDLMPAPAWEHDLEAMLVHLLDSLRYIHPDDVPCEVADVIEQMDGARVGTFNESGLMTSSRGGVVVRFRNGASFQLTIRQTGGED